MKSITLAVPVVAALFSGYAYAQNTADLKAMCSSADITAMIAKAKRERKADQANFTQPILKFAPYTASLEYRAMAGTAAVHETEAEMFYVIEGGGTLALGGKLTNEKRSSAHNLTGDGIQGGTSHKIGKGDFFVVPENTPHWFSAVDGTLVMMSLHLPRPVTWAQ